MFQGDLLQYAYRGAVSAGLDSRITLGVVNLFLCWVERRLVNTDPQAKEACVKPRLSFSPGFSDRVKTWITVRFLFVLVRVMRVDRLLRSEKTGEVVRNAPAQRTVDDYPYANPPRRQYSRLR
jgi:hypothetical protein